MKVVEYNNSRRREWDDFVTACPDGTPLHLIAWKNVIGKTFGYEPRYVFAEHEGNITAVLPMFLFSHPLMGRMLISTPFAVYGGICAANEEAKNALLQHAVSMAKGEKVDFLELRVQEGVAHDGFTVKHLYVSFDGPLCGDSEKQMAALPRDTRYMIRKGQKKGLSSMHDRAQLDVMHDLYAQSVRNLGTPVFPRKLFENLVEEFGEAVDVMTVRSGSEAVSSVLSLQFRDTIYPYYAGAGPRAKELAANNFMYWELMRYASQQGLRKFDFGRSKINTGAYHFKTQWNMRERSLPYQYLLVRRQTMPNFSPANPRMKMAVAMWRRVPLPLTKLVGPSLVRLFP